MDQEQKIEIKVNDEEIRGRYANAMQVSHSQNEFFLDFLLVHPPVGQMVGRIITSPGHAKRILAALEDNIKRYEDNFGKIEESQEPERHIGFKPSK